MISCLPRNFFITGNPLVLSLETAVTEFKPGDTIIVDTKCKEHLAFRLALRLGKSITVRLITTE